jgi:hypothetical protein
MFDGVGEQESPLDGASGQGAGAGFRFAWIILGNSWPLNPFASGR